MAFQMAPIPMTVIDLGGHKSTSCCILCFDIIAWIGWVSQRSSGL